MPTVPSRGLPPRIYIPIVAVIAIVFLGVMTYLVGEGFDVNGSVFGKAGKPADQAAAAAAAPDTNVQGGGPPAAVMMQVKTLRDRIAAHPNDDVSMTTLADMELTAGRFEQAIPLYKQALKVNPQNVAAKMGLEQARDALRESNSP